MSTPDREEPEHKATSSAEGDRHERQKELPRASQPLPHAQQVRPNRIRLPEPELRRRLWRLYDMALAAANRTEQTE